MPALKSENVLLPAARNEIVDSIATVIILNTTHPSSAQLEKVAMRFIGLYPSASDKVPGGTPYVSVIIVNYIKFINFAKASWKRKLQNKFKNLHRPNRAKNAGIDLETPTLKRFKLGSEKVSTTLSTSQLEEYSKHKKSYNRHLNQANGSTVECVH